MAETKKDRKLFVLAERWGIAFTAAWRTMERTVNPAFYFLLKCSGCGSIGAPTIRFVKSKKRENAIIGLECTSCLTTVKFDGMLDPSDESFPARLLERPASVLAMPGGKPLKDGEPPEEYVEMMLSPEDE